MDKGILHLLVVTLLALWNTSYGSRCLNKEDCLYKYLFSNYNTHIKPKVNSSGAVDVNVSLVVNSLMDIKERDEMMVTVGFLQAFWKDEFLVWDPVDYDGVDHLVLPAEKIWLPDIAISNSASRFYDITYKRDFHVHVSNEGQVRWSFGGIFSTSCHIQLEKYPFDTQTCDIDIENWMYTLSDVNLIAKKDQVVTEELEPNAVWYLHESKVSRSLKYDEFASLRFTMTWKRKTLYYYINIVIPIVLMLLVALGVFWLPADCGEKMSLAISIVLAFSVFQIIIMETTPVNSDAVPEITKLVMVVMIIATTALLSSMLAVCIGGRSTNNRAPVWLRTCCFTIFARILCMKSGIPNKDDDEIAAEENGVLSIPLIERNGTHGSVRNSFKKQNKTVSELLIDESSNRSTGSTECDINDTGIKSISNAVCGIKSLLDTKESNSFINDEWKYIAQIIDRVAFWITIIVLAGALSYIYLLN